MAYPGLRPKTTFERGAIDYKPKAEMLVVSFKKGTSDFRIAREFIEYHLTDNPFPMQGPQDRLSLRTKDVEFYPRSPDPNITIRGRDNIENVYRFALGKSDKILLSKLMAKGVSAPADIDPPGDVNISSTRVDKEVAPVPRLPDEAPLFKQGSLFGELPSALHAEQVRKPRTGRGRGAQR